MGSFCLAGEALAFRPKSGLPKLSPPEIPALPGPGFFLAWRGDLKIYLGPKSTHRRISFCFMCRRGKAFEPGTVKRADEGGTQGTGDSKNLEPEGFTQGGFLFVSYLLNLFPRDGARLHKDSHSFISFVRLTDGC
jgi:hypothetical protein